MKISDLLLVAETALAKHGDLDVTVCDPSGENWPTRATTCEVMDVYPSMGVSSARKFVLHCGSGVKAHTVETMHPVARKETA